ncbi:hypothetical protein [Occultella kanbiaonis]|uniref:hypothetical protein n=1 Tax=Occultella kanbiaonis TaxID=2675754 RepID=UPI0013D5F385|nr:hypothetical protein [Occultella kanbiaonis]
MTEDITTPETVEFDIFDWIDSGTVAQKSVTIYNDPALIAKIEDVQARIEIAKRTAADEEAAVGDTDELVALREEEAALFVAWDAAKSVWTVQALAPETINEINDDLPMPARPVEPKDDSKSQNPSKVAAYEKARKQFVTDLEAYLKAAKIVSDERSYRYIAAGLVSIVTPKGTATSISVDALKHMAHPSRPHGKTQVNQLVTAVNDATTGDQAVPAPKLSTPSGSTPA